MSDNDRQRVQHILYEGEVEVWAEQIADLGGPFQIILRGAGADLGTDLGDWLAWLLGPGRVDPTIQSRCRMAKRLRIVVDDLEPDANVGERREVEGDPPNLELTGIIKTAAKSHEQASVALLTSLRDGWRTHYRQAVGALRQSFMLAAAYELLTAQAERREREETSS